MGKSARAACKREVRLSRQIAVSETDDERAKFAAKQAAMAKAMAKPKIPVVNSKAHQNMKYDDGMMDADDGKAPLEVDEATLARARDAERRNDEAMAWGLNAVGKADIFLKTNKKNAGVSKGRVRQGSAAKQAAAMTFQCDAKSRKKMKRQLKQVKAARLKVPA